jgi:hypothetical protein
MSYRFSISLIEGRLREGTFGSGASAVPPRGLATRTGAALGIIPFGITPRPLRISVFNDLAVIFPNRVGRFGKIL